MVAAKGISSFCRFSHPSLQEIHFYYGVDLPPSPVLACPSSIPIHVSTVPVVSVHQATFVSLGPSGATILLALAIFCNFQASSDILLPLVTYLASSSP